VTPEEQKQIVEEYIGKWFVINSIEADPATLVKKDRVYKIISVNYIRPYVYSGVHRLRVTVRKRYGHLETFFQIDRFLRDFIEVWNDPAETIIFKLRFEL